MTGFSRFKFPDYDRGDIELDEALSGLSAAKVLETVATSCGIDLEQPNAVQVIFVGARTGYYEDCEKTVEFACGQYKNFAEKTPCLRSVSHEALPFEVKLLAAAILASQ